MTNFTGYSGLEGPNRPSHGAQSATGAHSVASMTSSGVCLTHTPERDAERRATAKAGIATWWAHHFARTVTALLLGLTLGGCAGAETLALEFLLRPEVYNPVIQAVTSPIPAAQRPPCRDDQNLIQVMPSERWACVKGGQYE